MDATKLSLPIITMVSIVGFFMWATFIGVKEVYLFKQDFKDQLATHNVQVKDQLATHNVQVRIEINRLQDHLSADDFKIEQQIGDLKQRVDLLFCKIYESECQFHGSNINSPKDRKKQ